MPAEDIFNITSKDTAARILNAEDRLKWLATIPDSLPAYIRLNDRLYNLVKKWKKEKAAGKYLDNIIHQHKLIVADTSLKNILIKAYGWWGMDNYSDSYNDSLVYHLEQFLLLTKGLEPEHNLTIYATQYLGIQYQVLGDLKKSGYYYNQYSHYAKAAGRPNWQASGAINTTNALNQLQLYDSSIQTINTVLSEKGINAERIASLYVNLAEAQSGKHLFNESIKSGNKSLQILNSLTPDEIDSSELFKNKYLLFWIIGNTQIEAGNLKDAETSLNKAVQFLIAYNNGDLKNRESGKVFLSKGRLFEAMGKLPEALAFYHKALYCVTPVDSNNISQLPGKNELYTENTIMEALDAKAAVLQKLYTLNNDSGMLIQAVQCHELAFVVENKLLQGFSYDESLMRQARESKSRSEKAIAACYELYRLTGSSTWPEKAFLFAEKSKGVVLQESVKRNLAANISLEQDSNWQQVQHLRQEVNFYERELATTATGDTASINLLSHRLNAAENNLLLANTSLLHGNSSYREALLKTDSLSAALVKNKLLDKNTALLEFFTGDSSTYIFLLTKNSPLLFIKAHDSLPNSINYFLQFFTDKNKINNEPEAYQAAAYKLYQQTVFPVINNDALKKLIIVPDGRLNFVPFDALVSSIKTVQNPKLFSYLLHQKQISYGYSVATLLKQSGNQSTASSAGFVLFAPVFANKERGNTPLLHSIEESDAIKKENSSGKFYLKEQATIGQFKNSVDGAATIHIASHANADSSGGLQPVIEFYDSSLYLNEIYTMHINPRLVVLSACETGIGIIDKSEGAMSLARGFYYAGAQNIITSLWSVDDRSTAGVFTDFYHHLNNRNYSLSLYEAKRTYLTNASISSASPYYWAGFIHIGYQKQSGSNNRTPWIIAALAAAILSLFMLRKRK